jgi:hypothetical protein
MVMGADGHLLDMAGRPEAASDACHAAARRTASVPEKRFLEMRAAQVLRSR